MVPSALAESVVRVLDRMGRSAGTGFMVAMDGQAGLFATCAHVVLDARVGPGEEIKLSWGDTPLRGTVVAEFWSGTEADDIAVVRVGLDGQPWPERLRPLPLAAAAGAAGAAVETWGFPDASAVHGLRGLGVVSGMVPEPNTGRPVLQLDRGDSVTTGYSGGPVLDLSTGQVIAMIHSITPGDRYGRQTGIVLATPTEALRAACPLLRLVDICPYRSLDVFEEEHARFLFGRSSFIDQMLAQLRQQPRFLTVLGPSGSGKSSVVRAGLLAAVTEGRVPYLSDFERVVARPDELDRLLPGATDDLTAAVAGRQRGVLLVLDQFEELFLDSQPRRARFLKELCDLLDSSSAVSVVLVMRDDFYSRLAAEAPELIRWVERGLTNIPARLTREELSDIVRGPAGAVRLRFEDGLADAIIDDAIAASTGDGGDTDGGNGNGRAKPATAQSTVLPLLEFTLTQLWQQRAEGLLRWQPYRDGNRVAGALTTWADDAVRALPPHLLEVARSLFTGLVHLGDERIGLPDSRRRRPIAELYGTAEQRPRLDTVLAVMSARRLLVTGTERLGGPETVELIHDVLLREWAELRSWLAVDREFLAWRQSLEPFVAAWQANPDATSRLLRGDDLTTAKAYLAARPAELQEPTRQFIERSAQAWESDQIERAAIERTLHEHHRAQIETELRNRAADIVKLASAEPARALAQAVSLISANLTDLPGEEPLGPVRSVLRLTVGRSGELSVLAADAAVRAVAFAPDGRAIAVGSDDGTVRLLRPDGTPLTDPVTAHWDSVNALAFHPDGQSLASGGDDGGVARWGRDGRVLDSRDGDSAIHALAYADGGQVLVSADEAGRLKIDGETVLESPQDPITAIACHPSAPWFAVATLGGTLRVLSYQRPQDGSDGLALGEQVTVIAAHEGFIAAVAVQPEGTMLASGGAGGVIRLWTFESGVIEPAGMAWQAHDGAVNTLAFSADGTVLASGSADASVRLWDVQTRRPAADPLLGHDDAVTSVAIAPDGTRIVSGGADKTVRLWVWRSRPAFREPAAALTTGLFNAGRWDRHGLQAEPAKRRHREHIYRLALSPDGRWIATASDDRTVVLSDAAGELPGHPFTGHQAGLRSVAFSADSRMLASASSDGTARLWDRRGTELGAPLPAGGVVQAVAFAAAGQVLACGTADGIIVMFDVDTGRELARFSHGSPVTELVFHPASSLLYSSGEDGLVRAWSATGDPAAPPLAGHDGAVRALAVAPDGGLLATGGDDHMLRLWNRDGHPVGEPAAGHDGDLLDVTFSPDGSMLLTASRDGTVRVWSLDGTQLGEPLAGHARWATSVVVTEDGKYALSVGADGTLRTWQLGGWRDWLTEACRRLQGHPVLAMPSNEAVAEFCARVVREGPP